MEWRRDYAPWQRSGERRLGLTGDVQAYRRTACGTQPDHLHPAYESSLRRAPTQPLVKIPHTLSEVTCPQLKTEDVSPHAADLTRQHSGEPLGQRILVSGHVTDEGGRAIPRTLIELWQASVAGRYLHAQDQHNPPLDPNFTGCGRTLTDAQGRYRFITIRPGCYPWRNHCNAWRAAHIHFSLFGPAFATRLVTQMYFPGDPLLPSDPTYNCTADEEALLHLISIFDWQTTVPETALGYRFNIVLRGREQTPLEAAP